MLNYKRYKRNPVIDYPERKWPDKQIEKAPAWVSVDLRDGNQALVEPMVVSEKIEMFNKLVELGFKEIEIGFPAASQIEFDFLRELVDKKLIPEDVTVQVKDISKWKAGGDFAAGDFLTSDANGAAVKATTGKFILAVALEGLGEDDRAHDVGQRHVVVAHKGLRHGNLVVRAEHVKMGFDGNVLYVSQGYDPDAQYGTEIGLLGFRYLSAPLPEWETRLEAGQAVDVKFKIRHTPDFAQGHLVRTPEGHCIHSDSRIQGIAAGQYATIYDNDAHLVVASGMIN